MPDFTAILRAVDETKFSEIFLTSARQAREAYFHRHSVRGPKKKPSGLTRPGYKTQVRVAELFTVMRDAEDEEMAEEMLRTWLLTKREMLACALDMLKIPHEDGLTESEEISKFEKLSGQELKSVVKALREVAPAQDVTAYLKFMGTEDVDKAVA